ncbi:hypothetical protein C8J56DRAFT_973361 [Mycena floridula]|nr:hypothetical protein C8J56DRAFT_973361 [Mycena floridula]
MSQSNKSPPGSLTVTGFALIENGCPDTADGSTSLAMIYDTQFFLPSSATHSLLGALRYFHPKEAPTRFEPGPYIVQANIAFNREDAALCVNANTEYAESYHIVSEISWAMAAYMADNPLPPSIHVTGLASDISMTENTFTVTAGQWTQAFRAVQSCPVFVTILAIPRFSTKKPLPHKDTYVGVSGCLSSIAVAEGENRGINYLCVELENITFLGNYGTAAVPAIRDNDNIQEGEAPVSPYKKLKLTFNMPRKSHGGQSTSTSRTPSTLPRKPANSNPASASGSGSGGSASASGSIKSASASGSGNRRDESDGSGRNSHTALDGGSTTASSSSQA